ncbi:MAG TPA: TRAP transporter large permease [Ramlibacter sp.]|nr:TRAP transporter large permease [Ramlibacter sp.]
MTLLLIFGGLFALIGLGLPVAIAMGAAGLGTLVLMGDHAVLGILAQRVYASTTAFTLLAIPFFILAGNLMNTGGTTERIFRFAHSLVGHFRGGLGQVNILGSMVFSGMSGSALADAMGLGAIEVKAMTKAGYEPSFSAAVSAASATIGPVIPPSIPLVIYGSMTGVSVGALFLGGVVPGVLMGLAMMVVVYLLAKRRNYPRERRATLAETGRALLDGLAAIITPAIMMGGILGGWFTPTEASVVACLYALILGRFVYRELAWSDLPRIVLETVLQTAQVMFIVAAAGLFGWVLIYLRAPETLIGFLTGMAASPLACLAIINLILLVLGCFMEGIAIMLLTIPIFAPILARLGIDPLHFGVVMTLNLMVGMLTPPVGMVLYAMSGVAKVPIFELAREIRPFLVAILAVLVLITVVPGMVTWLPRMVF